MKRARIPTSDLKLIWRPPSHAKPLCIGDRVRLNSGGPVCVVVDTGLAVDVIVSWRDDAGTVHEVNLPAGCFSSTSE